MTIFDLTEADFEAVAVDGYGKFTFSNALQNLRRSIVGLHNKIFPTFVMNDIANPIPVIGVSSGFTQANSTQVIWNASAVINSNTTTTIRTATTGKTSFIKGISIACAGTVGCSALVEILVNGAQIFKGYFLNSASSTANTQGTADSMLNIDFCIGCTSGNTIQVVTTGTGGAGVNVAAWGYEA